MGPRPSRVRRDRHGAFIGGETLALAVMVGEWPGEGFPHVRDVDIDGTSAKIGLRLSK